MNAEQAWQSVLGQLQMEMPRASFNTWVNDTQLLSYDPAPGAGQTAILTIGARNAYARDWLESRLTSTVSRLLAGMLNQAVEVRFAVFDAPEEPDDEDDDPDEPAEIAIEPVQFVDYEQIVQPHKQIVVKGYLRRLGVEIGPKAVWLYIGFHQAAWRSGSKQGPHLVRSREVLRFSGLSDGAFWRLMRHPEIRSALNGLVERIDPRPMRLYQRGRDGRPHRAPARYRVYLTPRLTRNDAQALYQHLRAALDQGQTLPDAIQALINLPDLEDGLLPPATETANNAPHFSKLQTVMDVARAACGVELDEPVLKLCQELHRKVINSLGEIHIRHYFIEQVIPALQLSPAQAWLITVARDMAYLNWRTGERRERVIFPGGYAEMAALSGVARYKTIQEWFSPTWKAHRKGGDISRFFSELEGSDLPADLRTASMSRCYRVLLDEPILDADGGNKADANGGIMADAGGGNRQTPMEVIADADGGNMVDANGGVKSTLNTSTNTKKKTTPTTNHAGNPAGMGDAPAFWELKPLLQRNLVHPKVQRELLDLQASVQAFVSWVLYACSPSAARLSDPLGYALSQLRADPLGSAGGAFDRFASLSPKDLLHLIDSTPTTNGQRYTRRSDSPLWPAWKGAMGDMNRAIPTAREILFGNGGTET